MVTVASVAVSNSTREYDREYHYAIPSELAGVIREGMRVIVPFGRGDRPVEAYVLRLVEREGTEGLKSIKRLLDESPVLNEEMLALAGWMRERYICTYADSFRCMLPPGIGVKSVRLVRLERELEPENGKLRKIIDALREEGGELEYKELKKRAGLSRGFDKMVRDLLEMGAVSVRDDFFPGVKEKRVKVARLAMPPEKIAEIIEGNQLKRIQYIRVLEMLMESDYLSVSELSRFSGVSPGVLNTLSKYGYIEFEELEVKREPLLARSIEKSSPMPPTPEQESVLQDVKAFIDGRVFYQVLLHGVTGSGKTEVYLQLIQHCLELGRQAIVLVPEISLTPQMVERFVGRFGKDVAVLHSRLSLGERYDQWRLIREGKIHVAVGARSAIFAPFKDLGIVIIDEEHEHTYKSQTTPRYHAREVAQRRCLYHKAVLLYGSATPSLETYYRAKNGEIILKEMRERANRMVLPQVELVDMRQELNQGNRSIFSRKLAEEIKNNIAGGQQTMLFLNRRGYASFILCRNCGLVMRCPHCSVSLTYHSKNERLICHYCGFTVKKPGMCPKCKSKYIREFGIGTQRVEEELARQFAGCTTIRMDMDTTSSKHSHEEILNTFRDRNINIMVGTQMITKGHDFPNVTLVGVLAADSLLNTGDYCASERTFQLLTQVAGRAGRGDVRGRVIIQGYNTEDFSILAACRHDYASFYSQEIKIREKLKFPPFTNIALAIISGENDKAVFTAAKEVRDSMVTSFDSLTCEAEVLGPARAPIARIKNKYRWRLIVKCDSLDLLVSAMARTVDGFYSAAKKRGVELSVDINPVSML